METDSSQRFRFDEFFLDAGKRRFLRAEEQIGLHAKAFDLLVLLLENSGRVVSKDELLETVWKDQFVEENNLTVQISALRKALGDSATSPKYLATIPQKGYQFIANVEKVVEESGDQGSSVKQGPVSKDFSTKLLIVAAAVAMILVAVFIYFQYANNSRATSLAVMPFTNETGDPADDMIADGLAESVIFELSRQPDLKILARDSSFRFRDAAMDPATIGRELGVESLLKGRITRSDDGLIVKVELISTDDNRLIWGGQISRKFDDLEVIQSELAGMIVQQLGLSRQLPGRSQPSTPETENDEAYRDYLTGRFHLAKLTDDGFVKARDSFGAAISKDPGFARAYSGLAEAYNLLSGWGAMSPNEGFPHAKVASLKAIELDPNLAEAHVELAVVLMFYDLNWAAAAEELSRAVELNHNSAQAYYMLGLLGTIEGNFDRSRGYFKRSMELDPLSISHRIGYGNTFLYERRFAEAEREFRSALEMDANSGIAKWSVGNTMVHSNRYDEAILLFRSAIQLSGDSPDEPASLAFALARKGDTAEARKVLSDLEDRRTSEYISPVLIATVYSALGETEKALQLIERAVVERDANLPFLRVDPYFDLMRDEKRFQETLRLLTIP
jgi:DNA-binding winged helix-turn-helix (wHTH) protein/TolB-like protein/cytochrome c-type biogenesis protein CcmH/NrfG